MTTSADIRTSFINALKGATDAGQSVFSPFDWPTAPGSYPMILVRAPRERKESLGRNAPLFTVTTTIEIIARTQSPGQIGDLGSAVALAAAEQLKMQIETTLINNPAVWADSSGHQVIQQFSSVESDLTTSSDGQMPMAELLMHIEVEFVQGPEDFFPVSGTPLEEVSIAIQMPDGTVEPTFSIPIPPPIS